MAGKSEGRKDKPQRDLRAELTEQLLTAMEKKDVWRQKPWDMGEMEMPFNAVTGQPYRGVNAQNLMQITFSADP